MQKVLIISYFFPPSNFVGGERTAAWAQHFNKFGIYPIVITRVWNDNQKDLVDSIDNNVMTVEKTDSYEIRRLPYKRTLRDRISRYPVLRIFQKILTFKELIFSNYFLPSLPYFNFYNEARQIILEEDVKAVIASGRPFQSFFIGHTLKREFDILWIPDYRDEWSTHQTIKPQGSLGRFLFKLESKSEKKWVSNADFFTATSEYGKNQIEEFTGIKGLVIKNGYDELIEATETNTSNEIFSIAYVGTLYQSQNIEPFVDALHVISKEFPDMTISCSFIGIEIDPVQLKRVEDLSAQTNNILKIIPRIKKEELVEKLGSFDLLFATKYENLHGVIPVKSFLYYASGISTVLFPSDNDEMERFILSTNSGYAPSSVEECKTVLRDLIKKKMDGQRIRLDHNKEAGKQYSREFQTELFAKSILDNLNQE